MRRNGFLSKEERLIEKLDEIPSVSLSQKGFGGISCFVVTHRVMGGKAG
jgi:hypothetical protein